MKSRTESLIRLKTFQVDEKRRQVSQIERMIAEFERMASDLEQQIEVEHQKTGISDTHHFAYSTFAKAARDRRANLLASAQDMRDRLEAAQDSLTEAVEELKRVEMLDQRGADRDETAADAGHQDEPHSPPGRARSRG